MLMTMVFVLLAVSLASANTSMTEAEILPLSGGRAFLLPGSGERLSDEESFLIPDTVFRRYCINFGYADGRGTFFRRRRQKSRGSM